MASSYYVNLLKKVIDASEANTWDAAVEEWTILDCEEDESCSSFCLCGKENLRYLFTIQNRLNGSILFPIGSSCINKFGRNDLNNEASVFEDMFKLLHAVKERRFISLSSDLFSRKLLRYLYDEGAFDNEYNGFDGENDYEFLLKMFNKHDKDTITYKQEAKIRAIIVSSIKPFLIHKLEGKR